MSVLTPQAKKDLEELLLYIVINYSRDTARKIKLSIIRTRELLDRYPEMGSSINHSKINGIRLLTVVEYDNYIIFYQIKNKQVEIIRFTHNARNWIKLLLE